MNKKCQVVMLPTNEKPKVGMINLEPHNSEGYKLELIHYVNNGDGLNPQHLYILSDEEIKEGDWSYDKALKIVFQTNKYTDFKYINQIDNVLKIIATTDEIFYEGRLCLFPKPSQSFIEYFVEEYNKGNLIDEVDVEYILNETGNYREFDNTPDLKEKLKINSDNTINVYITKTSWNFDEVKQKCWEAFIDHKCVDGKIKPSEAAELIEPFVKWVEQNLK